MAAQQQDSSAPPPQNAPSKHKKQDQQPPAPKKPSTADQNPFPEAQSEAAARQAQQRQQDQSPATPSAPAPQTPDGPKAKPSEADQNPFPAEQSRKAAQQANPGSQAPSGSAPGYSSSQTGLQGIDVPKSTDELRSIHSPSVGKKDTQVGLFYLKTGNYQGAYDRFVEATKVDPTNADAVFGLAESARHLNHRDEAVRNYQLYLSALPDGPRAKDARKGLKELGVKPAS